MANRLKHADSISDVQLDPHDYPFEREIVLKRGPDALYTNVPHLVTHHSPTGYEWGYSGSGCADLALNIVENILATLEYTGEREKCWDGSCWKLSYQLHQEFKEFFIASCPREGGRIPYKVMQDWVTERIPG